MRDTHEIWSPTSASPSGVRDSLACLAATSLSAIRLALVWWCCYISSAAYRARMGILVVEDITKGVVVVEDASKGELQSRSD